MTRPCHCGNADPGPYQPGWCYLCWLSLNDERYARLWAGGGPARSPRKAAATCTHLGDALTGSERAARGLSHARRWSLCLHPDKPLGDAVCGCMRPVGCGVKCPGYSAVTPH
jgi:hypothetical protein